MYSRKIKLVPAAKKKSKSSTPESSWGPRIALAEKEKAVAEVLKCQESGRKLNSYSSNPQALQLHANLQHHTHKKISVSSHSSSGGTNAHIYNHPSRKSSSGSGHKPFFLSQKSGSSSKGSNSYAGSSYILGSNPSSHHTHSTSTSTISQPLTLIIPNPSLHPHYDPYYKDQQDSYPSTRTYKSTSSHDDNYCKEESQLSPIKPQRCNSNPKRHPQDLRELENPKNPKNLPRNSSGILKVSTTQPLVHHQGSNGPIDGKDERRANVSQKFQNDENDMGSMGPKIEQRRQPNPHDNNDPALLKNLCTKKKTNSVGSTISSLAMGITMVYVPMEQLPKSKSAAVLNASLEYDPELAKLVQDGMEGLGVGLEQQDPDNDSLLESFDSVMFKPRDGEESLGPPAFTPPHSTSPGSSLSPTPTPAPDSPCEGKGAVVGGGGGGPPPLPPKNPSILADLRPKLKINDHMFTNIVRRNNEEGRTKEPQLVSQREISIRAAVENLENIIRPPGSGTGGGDKKTKRVTLAVPSPPPPPPQEQSEREMFLDNIRNYVTPDANNEIDAYSSTFLTCGHVLKEDDYSTLSSSNVSPTTAQSNNGEDPSPSTVDNSPNNQNSSSSITTQGEYSPKTTKESSSNNNSKSVLQQLRELSILIGGEKGKKSRGGKIPPRDDNESFFRLHAEVEEEHPRKISDATDNSADSGKGSGSGSSPKSSHSPSSPEMNIVKSHECTVGPCVFRSDCNECSVFAEPKPCQIICGSLMRNNGKKKGPSKIIRRKSSRISSKGSWSRGKNKGKRNHLIVECCDCAGGCCEMRYQNENGAQVLIPTEYPEKENEPERKISSGSGGSGSSIKLNRSVAFRSSSRATLRQKGSPPNPIPSGLFTIEEEENYAAESLAKARKNMLQNNNNGEGDRANSHWHPDCWLAADPMLGWSDLESLYSLNAKNDEPLSIDGECWSCWQEISEIKKNSENPNSTVDRTKRMFIWLNKRHKEFQAPWWEAKKQASIRWIMTKALIHVPKEYLMDPFKESKKSRPVKYRLRDEVIKGLLSGKLYSLSIANLYEETLGVKSSVPMMHGLSHWEIIKILSRRGVYVAQPSDMKLTQGTLRNKPIRIAAHIALIEAIMSLYSKEILTKERILSTLYTFGCTIKQETTSPEKLVIAWINAAIITLKNYIISTKSHQLSPEKQNRWLQFPKIVEIRDLCDGVGISSLFAIYCSNDLKVSEISVPEPGETLTIYDSISNHTMIQKLCEEIFPESNIYHLCVTDFLYIHGYMKQNILCLLVDLFIHLELSPVVRVNRLTQLPIRLDLA